jgi:hypothetical protein
MIGSLSRQTLGSKINGVILILLSSYWIYRNIKIIIDYEVSSVLYVFMIPGWVLIFESIIGLAGIVIGLSVYSGKWTIIRGYLTTVILWLAGQILEYLVISIGG